MITLLLELLWPRCCAGCQRLGWWLCNDCRQAIEWLPMPVTPELKIEALQLSEVWSMASYEWPISEVVRQCKYQGVKNYGEVMGELLAQWLMKQESMGAARVLRSVDVLTAVPLHPRRQRQRGFNQAELIAQALSKKTGIPYLPLLSRTRSTQSQAQQKTRAERLQNLNGAFQLSPAAELLRSRGQLPRSVCLIDDVLTTGVTLNHCAAVLKQAGCQNVYGLTVAHGQ